jgi:hypothetical protein
MEYAKPTIQNAAMPAAIAAARGDDGILEA